MTLSIKPNPMELVPIGEAGERDVKQIYLCQTNVEWHMHKGKYVFMQLLYFIDKDVFLRLANKYDGNRYVKQFPAGTSLQS